MNRALVLAAIAALAPSCGSGVSGTIVLALQSPSVSNHSITANDTTQVTVGFGTASPWPSNGRFEIIFPAGFNVAGATFVSATGVGGGITVFQVSGQAVTLARDGTSGDVPGSTAVTLVLGGIQNPMALGDTGDFSIMTLTVGDLIIDRATVPGIPIAGQFLASSATPSTTTAGAAADMTFAFTTGYAITFDGRFEFRFPAGFDVSAASVFSMTGVTGTTTLTVVGQVVTLKRTGGGNLGPGTAISIVLAGIVNPVATGPTGTFRITMQLNNGYPIDSATLPGFTVN